MFEAPVFPPASLSRGQSRRSGRHQVVPKSAALCPLLRGTRVSNPGGRVRTEDKRECAVSKRNALFLRFVKILSIPLMYVNMWEQR